MALKFLNNGYFAGKVGIGTETPTAPLDVFGVRAGRDWAINNRAVIRLDSNGSNLPSDILFGHNVAANQTSWTGVYWSLSSRGSSDAGKFNFYRGNGHDSPYNSEAVIMTFKPDLKVGIKNTNPLYELDVSGTARIDNGLANGSGVALFVQGSGDEVHTSGGSIFFGSYDYGNSTYIRGYDNSAGFQIIADGTRAMDIKGSGNVGIGTTNPTYKLDVAGNVNISGTGGFIRWNSGDVAIKNEGSYKLGFQTYNTTSSTLTTKMVLDTDGNVGIGTTSPAHKLDVNSGSIFLDSDWPVYFGSTSALIEGNSSGTILRSNASAGFKWTDGGNTHMTLDTNGNLGIGTTSPQVQLHVAKNSPFPNTNAVTSSNTGFVVSGNDGLMDLLSFDDNSTVATSLGMGRYSQTTGSIIDKWGLVTWYDTGNEGSNLSDRLAIHYGSGKTPWNNSEKLCITREGNVGIGTTGPGNKLQIGSVGSTGYSGNEIVWGDGTRAGAIHINSTGSYLYASANQIFAPGTSEKMRITSTGNVGIGTTNPVDKLHVVGTVQSLNYLLPSTNGTAGWYKIGTLGGFVQGGSTAIIEIAGHIGYNATNNQDYLIKLFIKTSNGGGGGPDGQGFNSWYERTGGNASTSIQFKWNNSATNDYDLYMYIPIHSLRSWYSINKGTGTWEHTASSATDPGANSSSVLKATGLFNILDTDVGIGTTSPGYKLDVDGDVNIPFGTSNGYRINGNRILSQGSGVFEFGALDYKHTYPNISTNSDGTFRIQSNGSTLVTVNQSGNVGIGTTSPGQKLHVSSGKVLVDVTSSVGTELIFQNLALDQFAADKNYHEINFITSSTSSETTGGYVRIKAGQEVSGNDNRSYLGFWTAPDDGNVTEKMRIDSSGNVGVGTTSPQQKFVVTGGPITAIASDGAYTAGYFAKLSSDYGPNALKLTSRTGDVFLASDYGSSVTLQTGNPTSPALYINANKRVQFNGYNSTNQTGTPTYLLGTDASGNVVKTNTVPGSAAGPYLPLAGGTMTGNIIQNGGNIDFSDGRSANFGTGDDLQIYHDGSNSYIDDTGTGSLFVRGSDIFIKANTSENAIIARANAAVELYHNNALKLETTSTGVDITGNGIFTGNVGIGTTSPAANLEITKPIAGGVGPTLYLHNSINNASVGHSAEIRFNLRESEAVTRNAAIQAIAESTYGTSPALAFLTSEGSTGVASERMRIDSSGNVGIGTSSPGAKLHVYSTANRDVFISGYGTQAQNDWQAQHAFFTSAGQGVIVGKANANNNTNRLHILYNTGNGDAQYLGYDTSSVNKVKLNTNGDSYLNGGNLGIGTTAPEGILQISKPSSIVYDGTSDSGQSNIGASVTIQNTNTTVNSFAQINMQVSASSNRAVGRIVTVARGSASSDMAFVTESFGVRAEKMRIDQTGNVGIGTTDPKSKLDVAGGVKIGDDTDTASANKVGTLRYRTSGNNSYVDMCMQTGATTYAWINIVQNNW